MNIIFLGMGMNWTRTSYLFLVVILISVGVTSAYAITITLGADPVNILGNLNVDGDIDLTGTVLNDDDVIFFDTNAFANLRWDDLDNRFEFSRGLFVRGDLEAFEGSITTNLGANIGGNLDVGGDIDLRGVDPNDDETIFFAGIFEGTKTLQWTAINDRFQFTDGLAINGPIQIGSIFTTPVLYNRIGTSTATHATDINANNDLLISGSLEVDGPSFFDNGGVEINGPLIVREGTFTAVDAIFSQGITSDGGLNFGTPSILTIATGAVFAVETYHIIAAEGVSTADVLITINGGIAGDFIIIKPDVGDTITVLAADETIGSNILTEGGLPLVLNGNGHAGFIFDGTNWNVLFSSNPLGS